MKVLDSLKDIFIQASKSVAICSDFCTTKMQRMGAALSAHSSLDHRKYHAAKLVGMGALFLFSAMTLNVEGAIGAGFATIDEINRLDEVGDVVLKHMPHHKIS